MKLTWSQAWRSAGVVVALLAWSIAAHLGSSGVGSRDVNAMVAVAPLLLACVLLLWQSQQLWLRTTGLVCTFATVAYLWPMLQENIRMLHFLQHQGSHLALAALFGRTLRGPGDALITQLARYIYGDTLSERKQRYTWGVTLAWTVFFVVNALVSQGLFIWAPASVWSVHANLMTGPLIALMFLAEYGVRLRMLPPHERPGLVDVIRAYRHRTARGLNTPKPQESDS